MQMFQYFIKVVPTDFVYLNGTILKTNQFSYTENVLDFAGRQGSLPGAAAGGAEGQGRVAAVCGSY